MCGGGGGVEGGNQTPNVIATNCKHIHSERGGRMGDGGGK